MKQVAEYALSFVKAFKMDPVKAPPRTQTPAGPAPVRFDFAPDSPLEEFVNREWIVTNGLGGYSSATLCGCATRRYHGLLVAALRPPSERTLLLGKIEEQAVLETGESFLLSTSEYADGTIHPEGYRHMVGFTLNGTLPTLDFAFGDARLQKTIWMLHERNAVAVRYHLLEGSPTVELTLRPLVSRRSYHHVTQGSPDQRFNVTGWERGVRVAAGDEAVPLYLQLFPTPGKRLRVEGDRSGFTAGGDWYWRFLYREERDRGLDHLEDLYCPGAFRVRLLPGESVTLLAGIDQKDFARFDPRSSLREELARQKELILNGLHTSRTTNGKSKSSAGSRRTTEQEEDLTLARLILAADQFLVARPQGKNRSSESVRGKNNRSGHTIIAGYPWFEDWGRDTMIALPGLTLATGRLTDARGILSTFAHYIDGGMLPNRFPDSGAAAPAEFNGGIEEADYGSADAALLYFHALDRYLEAGGDRGLLKEIYPLLDEIIRNYGEGTRHGIGVDPEDGLLRADAPGKQLTWMDAKVGDWVVTPRAGKPVELSALWYNALRLMEQWSADVGKDGRHYGRLAEGAKKSFNRRFWHPRRHYLFDVIDGPAGDDPTLRPNQILAVSLSYPVLVSSRWKPVLEAVEKALLTPFGLRTLPRRDAGYRPHYEGDQQSRDGSYHQGTVWPWLLGPYVEAYLRIHAGRSSAKRETVRREARALLEPLAGHLLQAGVGSISEIFDGDPPHQPRGCPWQAWSVAELLRAWNATAPTRAES